MVKCITNYSIKKLAKISPKVLLHRVDLLSEVRCIKTNPVVLLRRIDLCERALTNFAIPVPRLRFAIRKSKRVHQDRLLFTSREIDINEDDYRFENNSTDKTPSHGKPYESDWSDKKYKPHMEKIRNLTYAEIETFVKSNKKEYYEKIRDTQKPAKKNENPDTKDLFKCNPFNSEQQLAMYLTLRELFNVPETHFKQCKSFFTTVMPEISCQLFAQIFNVNVKSAPRLIKKLYPNPVSPF